jgi:hypothetical protein
MCRRVIGLKRQRTFITGQCVFVLLDLVQDVAPVGMRLDEVRREG